jgi:hypothetical protein
MRKKR